MERVDSATIARLLEPFAKLNQKQLDATSAYLDLLLKWNAKTNLTSVRDPREIVTRHFGESFFAASRLLVPGQAEAVADLGSGAGFPGLPFAVFAPTAQVTLLESNAKKAAFLNEVIHALRLSNVKTVRQRGEGYPSQADLVTMRAVEEFRKSAPVALGLVRDGGRLALMIGAAQVDEAKALLRDLRWESPVPIPGSHSRVILAGTKPAIVDRV
ncbi:MAG TPA: 16S rRNA (guanine(527)-N(7))-methyltransferase RsmG [Candidatus Angelobacter sp.]|nr:16S rRNA (guanine(527)-N(7))-methyltransferase RsmG [Candidatus Angelobacter sp.]